VIARTARTHEPGASVWPPHAGGHEALKSGLDAWLRRQAGLGRPWDSSSRRRISPAVQSFRVAPVRRFVKTFRVILMASPRRSPTIVHPDSKGGRFLIVEAGFYENIALMLREGAKSAFSRAGASVDLVEVPGALEIPIAMAIALDHAESSQQPFDGAIALGCVIRGETYHFEIVANECARALTQLAMSRKLAFGNGVLTVENEAQALERADPKQGDKGGDAARAALSLYRLRFGLKRGPNLNAGAL
jgi:6,7-dimethyl-8-ribityllumazine synthase